MNYKEKILDLISEKIADTAKRINGDNIQFYDAKPQTKSRMYSKEQMEWEELDAVKPYMKMYNKMRRLPIEKFMEAYFKGFITRYDNIYLELNALGNRGGQNIEDGSPYLQKQNDLLEQFTAIMAKAGK